MNCKDFERWLNEGMPEDASASAHAVQCEACATRLTVARSMDAALTRTIRASATAPDSLTRVVMQRVADVEAARAMSARVIIRDAMPWWVRIAAEPAVAVALVLCGLVLWQSPAILDAGVRVFAWLTEINGKPLALFASSKGTAIAFGVAISLLPAAIWLSRVSFRIVSRATTHATAPHLHRGLVGR